MNKISGQPEKKGILCDMLFMCGTLIVLLDMKKSFGMNGRFMNGSGVFIYTHYVKSKELVMR